MWAATRGRKGMAGQKECKSVFRWNWCETKKNERKDKAYAEPKRETTRGIESKFLLGCFVAIDTDECFAKVKIRRQHAKHYHISRGENSNPNRYKIRPRKYICPSQFEIISYFTLNLWLFILIFIPIFIRIVRDQNISSSFERNFGNPTVSFRTRFRLNM